MERCRRTGGLAGVEPGGGDACPSPSADYAMRKPNPLLFETAASLLGKPSREIWFVGDRLDTDVAGARAAGMVSVWLRPPNDERDQEADLVASSWSDLLAHVRTAWSVTSSDG